MAQREKNDRRIKELYEKGAKVYSFSKLNNIDDCLYGAKITYIEKDRGIGSPWTVLGNTIHDALQGIVDGNKTTDDLIPAMNKDLSDLEMLGLDFPKDFKGGDLIRNKWIQDMTHFCKTFTAPNGTFKTEQLLILEVNPTRYLIGYSDLIRFFSDGSVQVLDWKTSSLFQTKDLQHHGRQLVLYSMALKQAGYTVRDPAWIMLKYVTIKYMGKLRQNSKEETQLVKMCERCKIYATIHVSVEKRLDEAGITGIDQEVLMSKFQETNSLSMMPESIQELFTITPYVQPYELSEEREQEAIEFINRVADKFESLDPSEDWPPKTIDKESVFSCSNLCSHRRVCPYLRDYFLRESISKMKDEELF